MKLGCALCLVLAVALGGCAGEKAEGRPWVRRVDFQGVSSVRTRELAKKLAVRRTSWWGWPRRYLEPAAVDGDRDRIEAFYRAHGYFAARVTVAETVPRSGPKDHPTSVDVRFVVVEGPPSRITSFDLQGLAGVTAHEQLERRLREQLKPEQIFVHEKYLEARDQLALALRQAGYAWAEVDGKVEVDLDEHEARIHLTAKPGPAARFGEVRFEGLQRLAEPRLIRLSGIRPGSRFDPERLTDARGKLYHLGVFSSVRVDYEQSESDPRLANVVVHAREASFNELGLGIGLGLESYRTDIHGSLHYTRRNWLGGLRTVELKLALAWVAVPAFWDIERTGPAGTVEVDFTQPDWPVPLGELKLAVAYDLGLEYAYQYHGPRASLGLERGFWHENLQLSASYNFQFLQFFNTDPVILDNPALAGHLFGYTNPYRLGWLQEQIALDLRDHPINARKGLYAAVTFEQSGPYFGGAFQYEKVVPDLRLYAPLGGRVTLAGRFLFGQLFTQSELGSPITRRFYLGGFNSHRGFNYDRLSPQVPSGHSGEPPVPIGGDQMVLLSAELRVDVARLFGQWFSLVGFVDGGDVGGPGCGGSVACSNAGFRTGVDWDDLHWAAGGGLRYRTVAGTVAVDLGVRLNRLSAFEPDGAPNPDPGQRFAFHLSLGEAF